MLNQCLMFLKSFPDISKDFTDIFCGVVEL